ncbi:hypothetical protein NDU88_006436 [Pleurodeles waltl]|uniref:Uncharacterized protein n=1 Tax=Pleurodeles waltl TaxID=8319 RepID=A0AAV7WGB0_PLEWA|nr:hypothetical protein NDU88_006436 [Pleurodeles waltl]
MPGMPVSAFHTPMPVTLRGGAGLHLPASHCLMQGSAFPMPMPVTLRGAPGSTFPRHTVYIEERRPYARGRTSFTQRHADARRRKVSRVRPPDKASLRCTSGTRVAALSLAPGRTSSTKTLTNMKCLLQDGKRLLHHQPSTR